MSSDKNRLIELIIKCDKDNEVLECFQKRPKKRQSAEIIADHLLANGVIVPPVEVGGEIWVIDREDGEAVDISCVMFLGKSKGCIIATSWINDYDLDETLEFHINETQNNFVTDLKVYPDEDCFLTKEEAEQALAERSGGNAEM